VLADQLWFSAPYQVEVRRQVLPAPGAGQLRVKTLYSAISAGSELLVYRGQLPADIGLDATLAALQFAPVYPLPYGYACVGRVEQLGEGVAGTWQDKVVFSFQPHASHFLATPEQLIPVPDDVPAEAAVFLANTETAVNLVHDGMPLVGERVVVLGQGIVGLLLTGVLAQLPLAQLQVADTIARRREFALELGADAAFDPAAETQVAAVKQALRLPVDLGTPAHSGADLLFELSGQPEALNLAIALCGYGGRIIIGSWYGNKSAPIALGGAAHRHRIQFLTSQVSTIAPALSGRWDKARRFELAWQTIRRLQPQQWISHRVALHQAGELYQRLDRAPATVLQAVFAY
jgi:2-desacetyl-2-hydroxyethyl bacteriochlorophyllide A dehydrogenase